MCIHWPNSADHIFQTRESLRPGAEALAQRYAQRDPLLLGDAFLTRRLGTLGSDVEDQRVIDEFEAVLLGDLLLPTLDGLVEELDDLTAFQAHHMVVMLFLGELEDRMATVEIVSDHQARRLELSQHAIHRRQAHIFTGFEKRLVHVLGAEVVLIGGRFEDLQDLYARQSDFQSSLAQFMVLVGHGCSSQYQVGSGMIDRPHDSEEQAQMQKLTGIVTLSLALALTSGCTYFSVYKRDLAQGNLVTNSMVEQLRPGMSRQEVINLMGSPLLEAPFSADQWDYVYRLDEAYGDVMQRRVTLTFAGNNLVNIDREGDFSMNPDVAGKHSYGVGPTSGGGDDNPEGEANIEPIYNRTVDPERE